MIVQITDDLWVNPERVISVERRTVQKSDTQHVYTELTMETHTRWNLDLEAEEVVRKLAEW